MPAKRTFKTCAKKCKGRKQPRFARCIKSCMSGKTNPKPLKRRSSSKRKRRSLAGCPKRICKQTHSGRACRYRRVYP